MGRVLGSVGGRGQAQQLLYFLPKETGGLITLTTT